jgi:uncharacterized membrane protein
MANAVCSPFGGIVSPVLVRSISRYWLWCAVVLTGTAVLVLLPGGFAEKSRMLLHGLCAQTPTHSFKFGGVHLPFDARMTGVYGGTLVTLVYLTAQGRALAWGIPPAKVVALLALFVIAMAADGFNSLFTDLGIWHLWTPSNELRLMTGYLAGITLGAMLSWLLGSALYRVGRRQAGIQGFRNVLIIVAPLVPFGAILLSGAEWLFVPTTTLLILSAWTTMSVLGLAIIVLAFGLDARVNRLRDLHVPGAAAVLLGLGIMLALAFGRMWLEHSMDMPSTL